MTPRSPWSTGTAAAAVAVGVVAAAAGAVVVFLGSLCQIGASCTGSDHAVAATGFALIALGLGVPPLLAVWATRRWRWLLAPVVVVGAVIVAAEIDHAHNAARDRQALRSYQAALSLARTLDSVAGFAPGSLPSPGASVTERAALARRTQEGELATLRAGRDRLARLGIILGPEYGPGRVNVSQDGNRYCYQVPVFVLRGSALPGPCR